MHNIRQISPSLHWVGGNDRRLAYFENIFPLPQGISYNAYVLTDEKTALLDTVDYAVLERYFENVDAVLGPRKPDYLVVHHVEPDHAAGLMQVVQRWPEIKIVSGAKTLQYINQFYDTDFASHFLEVKEGEELSLGSHTLKFYFAPMVHWPEVMLSYEVQEKVLFSADAFGTFRALPGSLFNDEVDFEADFLEEARRYYANIVGKYGLQVQMALKKLAGVDIRMICPLHGPVWRSNLDYILQKYDLWSRYEPEDKGVLVAYSTMYGHTENAALVFAGLLADRGIEHIRVFDVSETHFSYIISDIFRLSHLVLAAPTYNAGLYPPMHTLVHDMGALSLQNRKVAVIGNGTWAPASHNIMQKMLAEMKNMQLLAEPFLLKSALSAAQRPALEALADTVAASVKEKT